MTPQFARGRRIAGKAGHTAILVFFVTFLAFPFYWMAVTTFKTTQDLHNTENNPYLFNNPPTLRHLSVLFEDTQYLQWLVNTGFVGVIVVLITLLLAVPAGYALARMTGEAVEQDNRWRAVVPPIQVVERHASERDDLGTRIAHGPKPSRRNGASRHSIAARSPCSRSTLPNSRAPGRSWPLSTCHCQPVCSAARNPMSS